MPPLPIEAPDLFKGAFSEKEVENFGLKKLSVEEAERLTKWVKGKKGSSTPEQSALSKPLYYETIQSIDRKNNVLHLLDNSIWEFPDSVSDILATWFPGQRVSIRVYADIDFPYLIENTSSRTKAPCIYLRGSSRVFSFQEPGFNFAAPVVAAAIIHADKNTGYFAMNDRSRWEISSADLETFKKITTPADIRYQKSSRKGFPFTFMDATSQTYFSAKPRLVIQKSLGSFSSEGLKQIHEKLKSGSIITLNDNSKWDIYPSDQEISFNWKIGDLLDVKKSKRQDFPTILINKNSQTSALAKPHKNNDNDIQAPLTSHSKAINQSIIKISNHGKYLYLSDGTSYKISAIDRGIVDLWLPDHRVEITMKDPEDSSNVSIKNIFMHRSVRGAKM